MTKPRLRNEQLRQAIEEARITYAQLAADIRRIAAEVGEPLRTNPSAVAHWINGRPPAPATVGYITEALSRRLGRQLAPGGLGLPTPETSWDRADARLGLDIGLDAVDVVRRLGEADINRREILTTAAYSVAAAALPLHHAQAAEAQRRADTVRGRRAGAADIAAVRSMLEAFVNIDERQGGLHGRTAVVQYLRSDVTDLTRARFGRETDRIDALNVAAAVTYLCGWKAYDTGEHGLAQRYYLQGLGMTREAGDPLHTAWMLRIMAHNGMDIDQPEHTLGLADAALELVAGRAEPGMLSLFVVTRARALGHAGRGREAVAEIRRAQDLAMRGKGEDLPYWVSLWSPARATVASHTAHALRSLGDHANAERHYASAARRYGLPTDGRTRVTALSLADAGTAQAAQGHLEQACVTWDRALTCFDGVYSDRAAKQVAGIRQQLTVFSRRGVGTATELDERARAWQLAHA